MVLVVNRYGGDQVKRPEHITKDRKKSLKIQR